MSINNKTRAFTLVITTLFLSGCTEVGLFLANLPGYFFNGDIFEDVAYGAEPLQRLDIYQPDNASETTLLPVVVFFYGGRWTEGSKEEYRFIAAHLANSGYVVVLPDYRKYPEVTFPTFVEDGAQAIDWVHKNIADYGGRPDQLFVSGHSSGAHIGGLLVSDESYLNDRGEAFSNIKGFAGLAGPYDFTPEEEDLKEMFGPPSQYPQMQLTTFVDGTEPPMFLLIGEEDELVGAFNLERLKTGIEGAGGQVESKYYPDIDHVQIVGAFSWLLRWKTTVAEDVNEFFQRQL